MQAVKDYFASLVNPKLMPTGLKVAVFVGSLLLLINHGGALLRHEMTAERWFSVGLTYLMPYLVNIHGQFSVSQRSH
jgi:hypothetical protein